MISPRHILTPAVALIAVLAGASCAKKKEHAEEGPQPVNVARAQTDSIVLHRDFPGYLQAKVKADVVAEVNGRLLTKNFEAGQYVAKGQVLYTIDPTDYSDAVERAQGSLSTARSQREFYAAQTAAMQKAYEQDAVSKMELLQSEANLRQAEASIKSAAASLNDAQVNLAKCTVRAPVSGYISDTSLSVGNYVTGAASPQKLATVYDNSEFKAVFSIEDSRLHELLGAGSPGSGALYRRIPLKFGTAMRSLYTADLFYVAPSVDMSTGTVTLEGTVVNKDNELKDGMYVTVSLPYGIEPEAVLVNDASISTDQLGKFIYTVNDSNRVVYTPVEVGELYRDSLRVVNKGVRPGQLYVTQALLRVRNGMEVSPQIVK